MKRLSALVATLLLSIAIVTGCGGGSTTPAPSITSVSVSCSPTSIQTNGTSTCTATVTGTGAYSSAVDWSATDGTITSSGVFTPTSAGTAKITAASIQDSAISGSTSITITNQTALTINIIDLPTVALANVTVTDPNNQTVKLTSSNTINAIPGAYTITAAPVVVGTSTYHATQTTQTVTVASGVTSAVTVDYYNIIPNTTKVLDQTGTQSLAVSSDGSILTISSTSAVAQSLQPGDVLVSGPTISAPNGVLVKVTAASNNGSSVVVTTIPATLADEVTQAHFGVDIPFALSSSAVASRKHKGYAIRIGKLATPQISGTLTNPCATATQSLSLPFSYPLPPDQNHNTITASGELDFCNLHVDYDINFPNASAKATVNLQQYSSLLLQGQYATTIDLNEALDQSDFDTQVVCLGNESCDAVEGLSESIGNALEVLTPSITPFVGMTGSASGGLYFGGTESGSFQAGVQVQELMPSPVYSGTLQQQSFPTAVDGNLDVKGYVGVTLGISLLGSDTVHIDPRAYAELQANTSASPWWTLSVGNEADAGLTVSFLGLGSKDYSTPEFTIYSALLAQASGPYSGLPTLSAITPDTAVQYGSSMTLSLVGTNFVPGCYATFNGSSLSSSYNNPTSLTVLLPSSYLATSGSYSIAVTNPDVGGTTSNDLLFTVTPSPNNPVPTISTLAPASLAAGSASQALTINGTGFLTSSTVTFNGISHTSTFVNANQLTISLSSADLATVGVYPVVVTNPSPGGGASMPVTFVVSAGNTPLGSTMGGMNPQRTNSSAIFGPRSQPLFSPIITGITGSLRRVGVDGTLIITSPSSTYDPTNHNQVVSAYTASGNLKWTTAITLNDGYGFNDVAIASSGTVYVTSNTGGYLYALSGSDGSGIWNVSLNPTGDEIGGMMIGPDGTIYLNTSSNIAGPPAQVSAVSPDGTIHFVTSTGERAYEMSVLSSDGSGLYLPGTYTLLDMIYGDIVEYSTATGSVLATDSQCNVSSLMGLSGGTVYAILNSSHIGAFPLSLTSCVDINASVGLGVIADSLSAISPSGTIISSLDGYLSGYSPSGTLLWTSAQQYGGGFVDQGGVLFEVNLTPGSNSNNISAIDSSSGSVLWQYSFPDPVYNNPSPNPLLIGPDGSLYIIAGQTLYRSIS